VTRTRSLAVLTVVGASLACASGPVCPYRTAARLSTLDAEPLSWEVPEAEEPLLTVRFDREPGDEGLRTVPLEPAPAGGWVFGFEGRDRLRAVNFTPPPEPCEGPVEWTVRLGLPGREDSEPVFFAAAVDYPPPEVFCPWDDEDNCLELSMWVP
jgi:hypothetical protein